MKKLLLIATLATLSTGAFASKARLEAFGESKYGSFVLDDYRNIYLNMAAINDYKNYATIELGAATVNSDDNSTPKGEAGVTMGHGNMVYGLHYGYYSDALTNFRQAILGTTTLTSVSDGTNNFDVSGQNVVDLMLGSKSGDMKWGFALQLSTSKDEQYTNQSVEQSAISTRFGIQKGKLQIGAIVALKNSVKAKTLQIYDSFAKTTKTVNNLEFKGKLGFQINTSYDLEKDYRMFNQITYQKADGINAAIESLEYMDIVLGTVKTFHFSKTNFIFTKFTIDYAKTTTTYASKDYDNKTINLPLSIGVEGQAAKWLMLRASAVASIYSSEDNDTKNGKITGTGDVALNAGASFIFGDLNIDGYVGTNSTGTDGTLDFSNLMTRVSMTYNF